MTKVIGITGGIGSGKSTITQFLKELGAVVIDADKVGHETFKPGTVVWREVVATFGKEIQTASGEIDRQKLGKIVFGNPEALARLQRLNQIMHPRMYDMMKDQIEEYRRQGVKVIVLEAAILIEANWTSLVDEVWVAVAPESKVIERLEKQRGLEKQQTLARIRAQLASDERVKHADVIIRNDSDLNGLKTKVKELWDKLQTNCITTPGVPRK
ncbi:MAG: dephospho-CoA kinase [Dehalococcoidales bacterium]|nr:dephospho-CoA kinase [Dehalococcoidales bacterium]